MTESTRETVEERPRTNTNITVPLKNGTTVARDSIGNNIKVILDSLKNSLTVEVDLVGVRVVTKENTTTTDNRDAITREQGFDSTKGETEQRNETRERETQKQANPDYVVVILCLALVIGVLWFVFRRR